MPTEPESETITRNPLTKNHTSKRLCGFSHCIFSTTNMTKREFMQEKRAVLTALFDYERKNLWFNWPY